MSQWNSPSFHDSVPLSSVSNTMQRDVTNISQLHNSPNVISEVSTPNISARRKQMSKGMPLRSQIPSASPMSSISKAGSTPFVLRDITNSLVGPHGRMGGTPLTCPETEKRQRKSKQRINDLECLTQEQSSCVKSIRLNMPRKNLHIDFARAGFESNAKVKLSSTTVDHNSSDEEMYDENYGINLNEEDDLEQNYDIGSSEDDGSPIRMQRMDLDEAQDMGTCPSVLSNEPIATEQASQDYGINLNEEEDLEQNYDIGSSEDDGSPIRIQRMDLDEAQDMGTCPSVLSN
ncbi:unnamed protein product [Arabidopsis thaliana]|uniref:(thale cress) hypothetical protein n=1 Tax=Arabidopsis thaliana TaxID=3702 RepID=A0A7G2E9A3_ARATH|nr:unnamed protein product [Arabidopsis thaliana]